MANIKQWKNYFIFTVATLMILLLGITMINIISPKLKSSYGLNWNEVWKTYVAGVPGTFSVDTVFFDGSDSYELSPQTASVFASTINILQKGVEDSNYDAPSTQHTSISVTGAGFNFNDSGETKYLDNMEDYYDFGGNGALLSYIFFFALMAKYDIFDVTHAREFFEALAENGTGGLLGLLSSTELKEVFYTAENDLTKKETGIYAQINTSPAIVYNNRGYLLTGMYQSINSSNGKEQVDANVMMFYYILTTHPHIQALCPYYQNQ